MTISSRSDQTLARNLHPIFDVQKAEAARRRLGLTYADMAASMGLKSRQAVGHWFRGRGEPSVQQLKGMAEALGVHWLELVTEETLIVYKEDERKRLEQLRQLGAADLVFIDTYLAAKAAGKQ